MDAFHVGDAVLLHPFFVLIFSLADDTDQADEQK